MTMDDCDDDIDGEDAIIMTSLTTMTIVNCPSQATKLNVYRNDSESWDFTNPNVGKLTPCRLG